MGSLYVDGTVEELRADGQSLALYAEGRLVGRVPAVPLERVIVQGNVLVATRALHLLAQRGVAVHFLSGRHGRWRASLVGPDHNNAELRVAQVRVHLDPERRVLFARRWVSAKLQGQLENLELWLEARLDDRGPILDAKRALASALDRVAGLEPPSLLGVEGAAARAYFAALAEAVPSAFGFHGRNRRPPLDPVNALLSLAYTLVHSEWASLLRSAGFDPNVGFFHALDYGRESLASDLLEPRRPAVDRWVVGKMVTGAFRPEDFAQGGERAGCWLKAAARRRFYMGYESWSAPLRYHWREEAYALAREIHGETQDEEPVPDRGSGADSASRGQYPADRGDG